MSCQSEVSTSTIKRVETTDGVSVSTRENLTSIRRALEAAGIKFNGTSGDTPGIGINKRQQSQSDLRAFCSVRAGPEIILVAAAGLIFPRRSHDSHSSERLPTTEKLLAP